MHHVVVCPRCKGATAVREDQKSATCPHCGRSYDPRRSRVYDRSEDPAEVARLVGEMNARLEGGYRNYEADAKAADRSQRATGDLQTIAGRVSRARGMQRQLEEALRLLCAREGGAFSSEDLYQVLGAVGWEPHQSEDALKRLLEEGAVTEVRPDTYRMVPG